VAGKIGLKEGFKLKVKKFSEMKINLQDSNNFSCGIHFFKVLVQIHYSAISIGVGTYGVGC
jgi:hypothetical protein